MASATVRISGEEKEVLQKLSAQTNKKMREILEEAVELYRRKLFLEEVNGAFARLRKDPRAWGEEEEERAAWKGTLSDGIED